MSAGSSRWRIRSGNGTHMCLSTSSAFVCCVKFEAFMRRFIRAWGSSGFLEGSISTEGEVRDRALDAEPTFRGGPPAAQRKTSSAPACVQHPPYVRQHHREETTYSSSAGLDPLPWTSPATIFGSPSSPSSSPSSPSSPPAAAARALRRRTSPRLSLSSARPDDWDRKRRSESSSWIVDLDEYV